MKNNREQEEKTALWWIRRDLRLHDNQALQEALSQAGRIVPLFIIDPALVQSERTAESRLAFLWGGLEALREELKARGGDLLIRKGDPLEVLQAVSREMNAGMIFAEEDFTPYARSRDERIQQELDLRLTPGLTIAHPETIEKNAGGPYQVYSYYMRKWKKNLLPDVPEKGSPLPDRIRVPKIAGGEPLPAYKTVLDELTFSPGEKAAKQRLKAFLRGDPPPIYRYGERRDRPDLEGTSGLSPYFHFGMISTRRAVAAARDAIRDAPDQKSRESAATWLEELIWREFYLAILYHFPHVLEGNFREKMDHIPWRNNQAEFQRWKEGQTGYPLVDAAMRQLKSRQWMHNRARMIVASFLVKDLLIDWRWGETWFLQNLLDGDLAANNGGWQWVAGTGTDAAPYFRIFNPVSQSRKYDPRGDYIRQFVPELRNVPDEYLHAPWEMPPAVQKEVGCVIGKAYPAPIVDHQEARERTLQAYQQSRDQT